MEGLNKEPLPTSKIEIAENSIVEYFGRVKELALARIKENPHYNNLSERIDF